MKITIDLEDFWLDGETDLESGLKDFVKREVLKEINKSIEKRVEDHLTTKIKEEVEKHMYKQMNSFIADFIKTGQIKSSNYSDAKMISVEEYVKQKFSSDTGWSSPNEQIKTLAKKFGDEMKARYDLLFASQLVAKLNDTGLLKKDAARLLLDTMERK